MKIDRRQFIGAGAILAATASPAGAARDRNPTPLARPVEPQEMAEERTWLGPDFWANRLQDWRRNGRWIECINGRRSYECRTAALLTRDLAKGGPAAIEADIAADAAEGSDGFGGFLIGIGKGRLDPLSAALAQRGSGEGGGIMAVVDPHGIPHFREHNNDDAPLAFAELRARTAQAERFDLFAAPARIRLTVEPLGRGMCRLLLTSRRDGREMSATLDGVPEELVTGGIALVSSPPAGQDGARFRFAGLATGGARIRSHPDRAVGACLGSLYSIANGVLKVSAQFQALGEHDSKEALLQVRARGSAWRTVARGTIGDGFTAIFRVPGWDSSRSRDYRILWGGSGRSVPVAAGIIRRDPVHGKRPLVVAMESCVLSTQHALEDNLVAKAVPQERSFGRYEPENFNFPHRQLVTNSLAHDPDLVFVSGDQYYESNPTRKVTADDAIGDVALDTLYRWFQWHLSFAPLVRDRPTIVLVDDHDVLQGNLWGNGGREAPAQDEILGGYIRSPDLVRMVYRIQCGANPDTADPAPVLNDIPAGYCRFEWGGTEFALIEDRKWKTSPIQGEGLQGHVGELLGARQEAFLAEWAAEKSGKPRIILTQSAWATIETEDTGQPVMNFDGNGYPALGRRKAVQLAKEAGAVILAGDLHLGLMLRHGIDRHGDGPLQFVGPAGGTFWQRWFEPAGQLPNGRTGLPNTGDWRDAFGNPVTVVAVANPKISYAEFRKHVSGRSQVINDRALKSEGYGIVRVDADRRAYTFECWQWDKSPALGEEAQFPGWPYHLPFSEA